MRCDLFSTSYRLFNTMFQSTHLHEVWQSLFTVLAPITSFQSTHLHEVWPILEASLRSRCLFQSTHLHEVWQKRANGTSVAVRFNPHTYMRCDENRIQTSRESIVSIHTPTWGVTQHNRLPLSPRKFQSTHLHEVWHLQQKVYNMLNSFNPHTYMRCD